MLQRKILLIRGGNKSIGKTTLQKFITDLVLINTPINVIEYRTCTEFISKFGLTNFDRSTLCVMPEFTCVSSQKDKFLALIRAITNGDEVTINQRYKPIKTMSLPNMYFIIVTNQCDAIMNDITRELYNRSVVTTGVTDSGIRDWIS